MGAWSSKSDVSPHQLNFNLPQSPRPGQNLQEVTPRQSGAGPSTAYSAQPAVSNDQFSHLPKLHRSIIAFIQAQPSNAEGVHVSAIARAVGGNAVTIRYAVVLH